MKDLVLLKKVYGPHEAEIIAAKLESCGIRSFVRSDSIRDLYGIHIDGLGAVEIFVHTADLELAEKLLDKDDDPK